MTTDKVALFIPSLGRPQEAYEAFRSADYGDWHADVVVVVEEGPDYMDYKNVGLRNRDMVIVPKPSRKGFVEPLNEAVRSFISYANIPKYIGFMGDDHRIRTPDWWNLVLDRNEAFVYGDDLFQGQNLPTAVFIRGDIVKSLGYFAPPSLQHLYVDNAWRALGQAAGSLYYEPRLVIEHLHADLGKRQADDLTHYINSLYGSDAKAYESFVHSQNFKNDVETIKACL